MRASSALLVAGLLVPTLLAACTGGADPSGSTSGGSSSSGGTTDVPADGATPAEGTDGGAGAPAAAPEIAFSGLTCQDVSPCDGDLAGTWDGEVACSKGLFDWFDNPPTSGCADFKENKVTGKVAVRYTFTATTMARSLAGKLVENVDLPLYCARNGAKTCDAVAADVVGALYGVNANPLPSRERFTATCKAGAAAGSCNCDVTLTLTHAEDDVKTGYQLSSAGSAKLASGEPFSFCRQGSELSLRTTSLYLSNIFYDTVTYSLRRVN
jgi:hypothetical protein